MKQSKIYSSVWQCSAQLTRQTAILRPTAKAVTGFPETSLVMRAAWIRSVFRVCRSSSRPKRHRSSPQSSLVLIAFLPTLRGYQWPIMLQSGVFPVSWIGRWTPSIWIITPQPVPHPLPVEGTADSPRQVSPHFIRHAFHLGMGGVIDTTVMTIPLLQITLALLCRSTRPLVRLPFGSIRWMVVPKTDGMVGKTLQRHAG